MHFSLSVVPRILFAITCSTRNNLYFSSIILILWFVKAILQLCTLCLLLLSLKLFFLYHWSISVVLFYTFILTFSVKTTGFYTLLYFHGILPSLWLLISFPWISLLVPFFPDAFCDLPLFWNVLALHISPFKILQLICVYSYYKMD